MLILEYQKNANPDSKTLHLLEFWEGEEWREDRGKEMRRFIWRLVEDELIQQYQCNSRPDAETKGVLESCGEEAWSEDIGEEGRKCILLIMKEEWKSLKPSLFRYHQELKKEHGEQWNQNLDNQNLDTELKPSVQRLLGEHWKEEAAQHKNRLEEEDKKVWLIEQRMGEGGKRGMEDKPTEAETAKE